MLKENSGIRVLVPKPLIHNFQENNSSSSTFCYYNSRFSSFFVWMNFERKSWIRGFGIETPIPQLHFRKKILGCRVNVLFVA